MKTYLAGILTGASLALALFSWLGAPRPISADERLVQGGGEAGMVDERLKWKNESGGGMSVSLRRTLVKVPKSYGQLVSTSGGDASTTLWFVNADGDVRNVVLANAKALYQIESEP